MDEFRITDPKTGGQKGSKLAKFASIPPDVLWELAEHFGRGESKYPDTSEGPNWQRGYSWKLSIDALHRHLALWEMGEETDQETNSSHLVAVIWHAMVLRWFQLHSRGTDYRGASLKENYVVPPETPEKDTCCSYPGIGYTPWCVCDKCREHRIHSAATQPE